MRIEVFLFRDSEFRHQSDPASCSGSATPMVSDLPEAAFQFSRSMTSIRVRDPREIGKTVTGKSEPYAHRRGRARFGSSPTSRPFEARPPMFPTASAGLPTAAAGFPTAAAGFLTPAAGFLTPAAGFLNPAAGFATPAAGFPTPAAGFL